MRAIRNKRSRAPMSSSVKKEIENKNNNNTTLTNETTGYKVQTQQHNILYSSWIV